MALTNLERMMQLIEDTFATRTDPSQIQMNEKDRERLKRIHPSTLSEYNEGNGPGVWIVVIPTTNEIMQRFIKKDISENDILYLTPLNGKYDSIYLSSALALPEFRRKGIAAKLIIDAIQDIRRDHPLKNLFVWAFSPEGDKLAQSIADKTSLKLFKRDVKKAV